LPIFRLPALPPYFTRRLDPERETRRLIAKLEALGHRVTLEDAAA
jgi:hypothetical protein